MCEGMHSKWVHESRAFVSRQGPLQLAAGRENGASRHFLTSFFISEGQLGVALDRKEGK